MDINKNKLTLFKNQTHSVLVNPYVNKEPYRLQSGETVIFSIKTGADKRFPVLLKKKLNENDYADDSLCLTIEPDEIDNLPAGSYVYDCVLKTNENRSYIFIKPSVLMIKDSAAESGEWLQ